MGTSIQGRRRTASNPQALKLLAPSFTTQNVPPRSAHYPTSIYLQATVKCAATLPLRLDLHVRAFAVDEQQVSDMERWVPCRDPGLQAAEVAHTVQLQPVHTHLPDSTPTTTYSVMEEFAFTGMSFDKPSQVPRPLENRVGSTTLSPDVD